MLDIEKEMLRCNLNNHTDFPEDVLNREVKIYYDGVKDWDIYGSVPKLEDWKNNIYEFPNLHIAHKKIVDTVLSLNVKDVCEAGAGAGVVSKYVYASKNDINLTCLEGSDIHISQMRMNFNNSDIIKPQIDVKANIVKGILQDIPIQSNQFDIVYTCTVMMHVPFLMVPKAVIELSRISRKYILHVENMNNIINTVCMGKQESSLNTLCIDYEKMYEKVGVKKVSIEIFKDPHSICNYICFLGEKQ